MTRRRLTDKGVAALKPRAARFAYPDPELVGHYVMIQPSGVKTFKAVTREPLGGKQIWVTLGRTDHLQIEEARAAAREAIARIRAGKSAFEPLPPKPESFQAIAENWFTRHVEAKQLRTRDEMRRCLEKYIYPTWAEREFASIRKADVARLLDYVEDNHGPRQADAVLATIGSVMNWQAARLDDYLPPISRGMRRTKTKERARTRILTDDEIRAVWKQAEANGAFGGVIQLLLVSGQRLSKVASMHWDDVSDDGAWSIRSEAREKGNAGTLVLPASAVAIIRAQPQIEGNPHVFAGHKARTHISNWGKRKKQFDAALPPMPAWVLHDLRRTARSLLSRAGVLPHVCERVLGHVQPGVLGTYDRHAYVTEMADALRKLAALIESIVNPPTDNVLPIRRGRKAR
jgi:integrase